MKRIITPLLVLSAALITPAYANYFSNPATGISLNIGSAPNPTPEDIRLDRMPKVANGEQAQPDLLSELARRIVKAFDKSDTTPPPGSSSQGQETAVAVAPSR
jgi:hypothetical protein